MQKKSIWAIVFLLVISLAFFSRLFIPKLSLFFTPEFSSSDIWHFNYPIKSFLSDSLKQGNLPLWSKFIDGGFPLFAEGQTGTFNIYNFLAFALLPLPVAFNLGYIVTFFFAGLGMYFFSKAQKLSAWAAVFAGFTFSYSGFFVAHINHFNVIQAAAFLPWIFLFTQKAVRSRSIASFALIALFLSQQILTGFYQVVVITLVGIGLYLLFLLIRKKIDWKFIFLYAGSFVLSLIASAAQLMPTYKLLTISNRAGGLPAGELSRFTFPFVHFLTFLHPFLLGNPTQGTYPPFTEFEGSIFWENTGYIGILPLLLVLLTIFFVRKKKFLQYAWAIALLSVLLIIGRAGPMGFVLDTSPFTFFRVSSRFLLLLIFALSMLAGFGLDFLKKVITKRVVLPANRLNTLAVVIVVSQVATIFAVWWNYHPTIPLSKLEKPEILQHVNVQGGVFTYAFGASWFEQYKNGDFSQESLTHFTNELAPNSNALFDISARNLYFSFLPARTSLYNQFLSSSVDLSATDSATISPDTLKLLSIRNTETIISPTSLTNQQLDLTASMSAKGERTTPYYVYRNTEALPRAYLVHELAIKTTVPELFSFMFSEQFIPADTVILEDSSAPLAEGTKTDAEIVEITTDTATHLQLAVTAEQSGYVVVSDSFYPGWQATVDGQPAQIYPANLLSRAVFIRPGKHVVEFFYKPESFRIGSIISIAAYVIIFGLIAAQRFGISQQIVIRTRQLFARH